MEEENRKTGIDVICDAPWGTHFCQFYETKEDLIDVLMPYFKAGLENNEFCMWVTSQPLNEEEAEKAMRKAVPDFDRYLKRGQMEIVPHTEWYLKDGAFNLQRVLNAWIDKLNQALAEGYDGIRVTGNTAWLENNDWRSFVDYEGEVNDVIGEYRMMAVCTYSLDKCGASEVIDVVRNHQFALIKRRGEWELIESSEPKQTKEALRESEEKYRNLLENARDTIMTRDLNGTVTFVNRVVEEYGFKKDEIVGKSMGEFVSKKYLPRLIKDFAKVVRGNLVEGEIELITPKGKIVSEYRSSPIRRGNKVIGSQTILRDISERKKMKEALECQRDVAITLSSAGDLSEVLNRLFDGLLEIEEFDCAGFYLVDEDTGDLDMIVQRGLPEKFVEKVSHLDADSSYAKVVMEGKPIYQKTSDFPPAIREDLQSDGVLAVAAIPIQYKGEVIGDLNMASHTHDEISASTRQVLESVGAQIGEAIVRARMEEKLRESEERFRNLYESIQDPVGVFVGREGRLVDHNKAFNKLSGYTDEELKGKAFLDFIHPDDQALVLERYRTRYPEEKLPLVYEIRGVNKNGEAIPLEISVSTYKKKGRVIGIEIIHRDITERKQMEEELRESEERLRNLYESVPDALAVYVGREGHLIEYNKAFNKWCGYTDEELKDKIFLEFVHPDYHVMLVEEYRKEHPEEELPFVREINGINKKGESIPTEISVGPYKKKSRVIGINVMHRDITERKKMEKKLQEYADQLEEKVEERTRQLKETQERLLKAERLAGIGETAAMVGHDLRNPLQAIVNTLYLVKKKLEPMSITDRKIVEKAGLLELRRTLVEQAEYMNKIVSDLQDYARPMEPKLIETSLHQLINDALSTMRVPETVKVSIAIGENFPKLMLDPAMMKRAFSNLITNALQAMPNGGQLTITASKKEENAFISIQDTGAGILEEHLPKIFQPLFTTKAMGQGFGLPVCKRLVEAHEGNIKVASKVGKGSTFTVKIPLRKELS